MKSRNPYTVANEIKDLNLRETKISTKNLFYHHYQIDKLAYDNCTNQESFQECPKTHSWIYFTSQNNATKERKWEKNGQLKSPNLHQVGFWETLHGSCPSSVKGIQQQTHDPQKAGPGLNLKDSLHTSSLMFSSVYVGCSKSKLKGLGHTGSSLIS